MRSKSNEQLRAPQASPLGEQFADILVGHRDCATVGMHLDAQPRHPLGEAWRNVPSHFVAVTYQALGNAGQRAEVTRERHGGDEDPHAEHAPADRMTQE